MSPDSRRAGTRLLIGLDEVLDLETGAAVERNLDRLLRAADASVVVIDVTTPLVTAAALHVLLRLRNSAQSRGVEFRVIARRPTARRVFRLVRLERLLRVSATLSGAETGARGCPPSHYPGSRSSGGRRPRR